MDQVAPLLVVFGLVAVATLLYRRFDGAPATTSARFSADELHALGVPQTQTAILLFTAPGCPPCVPAKRVLEEVAARHGVPVVVADVSDHHALAAGKHIYRAPTAFVLDEVGRAVVRIAGIPHAIELDKILATPARAVA